MSILLGERKRARAFVRRPARNGILATAATTLVLICSPSIFASAPGLDSYRDGKFPDAYQEFQQTLQSHPQTKATDKLQFDSGAAAYKMKDYGKALESFSQALLSPDAGLQSKSHYNLGNTLYERGEAQQGDDKKLADWTNALQHYEQTLKLEPQNKEAKENSEYVKKKIEELKNKKQQQPSPTPPPQNKQEKNDKNDQQKDHQQQQQQSSQDRQRQKEQQSQDQSGTGKDQKQEQSQAKNEPQKSQQSKAGESPSPSPGEGKDESPDRQSSSGDKGPQPSPTQGQGEHASPSPSSGEGEQSGEGASPSPAPAQSPQKKFEGEIKDAAGEKSDKPPGKNAQIAEAEEGKDGQMSERQAEALLQSMKDEEAHVQLDERRAARHVYNDW